MLPNPQYSPLARQTTKYDRKVAEEIIEREGTREAILYFEKKASKLSDYAYWFYLSTCWVSYTGWSDLQKWKKLFNSKRPDRMKAIMKPFEVDFLF
ncbi:hypothetical protein [Jeotgalibacillus terrae]|uniref:Uncharacterized protein n=1 Tax=Jeotgalibacillus terrae TaxID=587735 RepID=A0ABW5ZFU3_9BACL|nr:hypothetical protein [Jeotgalibacillus terrae]MBM7580040.1 hypothetical protein [Jeotgalibacillus terrae]